MMAAKVTMAIQVGEAAATTPGKRSLAMESFAAALRAIPTTICDNAGAPPAYLGCPTHVI